MEKQRSFKQIYWIFMTILICSCSNGTSNSSTSEWANTSWENLKDETIKFKKPTSLLRSSRYRIKNDLPRIADDQTMLTVLQNRLEVLEFQDSNIDIFVDTTTNFRVIIMCNVSPIPFTKSDVSLLKRQISQENSKAFEERPTLKYGEVEAKMGQTKKLKLAKFKTQIANLEEGSKIYNSIYYVTSNTFSVVCYEFSDKPEDIEKYLWTLST